MIISDHGLILDHRPFRDHHLLVAVLSCQRGVLRGVLRGARKGRQPASVATQTLSQVQFSAYQRPSADMATFQHIDLVRSSYRLTSDLRLTAAAACTAEILSTFCPPDMPASRQYRLGVSALEALLADADPDLIVSYVQAWILALSGLLPDLDICTECGGSTGSTSLYSTVDAMPRCHRCLGHLGPELGHRDRAFLRACQDTGPGQMTLSTPPGVMRWLDLLSRIQSERSLTALDFYRHHAGSTS